MSLCLGILVDLLACIILPCQVFASLAKFPLHTQEQVRRQIAETERWKSVQQIKTVLASTTKLILFTS